MLVEVTVPYLPMFGVIGTRREIPAGEAHALIVLKKVRVVDDDASLRSTRRVYQRRDMQAEGSAPPSNLSAGPPPDARVRVTRKPRRAAVVRAERDE